MMVSNKTQPTTDKHASPLSNKHQAYVRFYHHLIAFHRLCMGKSAEEIVGILEYAHHIKSVDVHPNGAFQLFFASNNHIFGITPKIVLQVIASIALPGNPFHYIHCYWTRYNEVRLSASPSLIYGKIEKHHINAVVLEAWSSAAIFRRINPSAPCVMTQPDVLVVLLYHIINIGKPIAPAA